TFIMTIINVEESTMTYSEEYRIEEDLLAKVKVPANVYYGAQTLRAVQNFDLSGVTLSHFSNLVCALAIVKHAAADANAKLGYLTKKKHEAITYACRQIKIGRAHV